MNIGDTDLKTGWRRPWCRKLLALSVVAAASVYADFRSAALAALEPRLGGAAYYDTVLDITWLGDANAAAGTAWDDGNLPDDGWLTWDSASDWIAQLQLEGIGGWRMANMDVDADQVVVDCSRVSEAECRDNEYGYMFYQNGITGANPGPFAGTLQAYGYWAGNLYQQMPDVAWLLTFGLGIQHPLGKTFDRHVWPVRDGDIESDQDSDGVIDAHDNCPTRANPAQEDRDSNGTGDACEPPKVSGVWPGDGVQGDNISLFIFGEYFDVAPGATRVSINGTEQPLVQAVTSDLLIVRTTVTPDSAGPVTVVTASGAVDAPVDFGQSLLGLGVSGIWPTISAVGELVFVFGNDFEPGPAATRLSVGSTLAPLVHVVDPKMLIFSVPAGSSTAPVFVTTSSGTAYSPADLEVADLP